MEQKKLISLRNMVVLQQEEGARLSCDVVSDYDLFPRNLWFHVKGVELKYFSGLGFDWALVAIIYPAMLHGYDIFVEGNLSRKLLMSLRTDLQAVLRIHDPRLTFVNVDSLTASGIDFSNLSDSVATGFSAGIDSFSTLALFSKLIDSKNISVTHICTFNVGAMGSSTNVNTIGVFEKYVDRSKKYASEFNLKNITVNSNISEFYKNLNFQKTHTLRNASAALTLERFVRTYLYSSTYDYRSIRVSENYDTAFMDPILLGLLSTENLTFISAGAGLSRYEKTKVVGQFPPSYSMLDVCIMDAKTRLSSKFINCSNCWKCKRTMVSLDSLDLLDKYRDVFDVESFYLNKESYYDSVRVSAMSGVVLDREVLDNIGWGVDIKIRKRLFYAFSIGKINIKNKLKNIEKKLKTNFLKK